MGYSSKDKKPFDELDLVRGTEAYIHAFLESQDNSQELISIVESSKELLESYYSPFSLELLSTVDFVAQESHATDEDAIKDNLSKWSERKEYLFAKPHFINTALNHLKQYHLV